MFSLGSGPHALARVWYPQKLKTMQRYTFDRENSDLLEHA
jgi:hypothetical protein